MFKAKACEGNHVDDTNVLSNDGQYNTVQGCSCSKSPLSHSFHDRRQHLSLIEDGSVESREPIPSS